jgi:hypothetical protein
VAPAIDEAIEALPPQLRDAIVLHYLQGQTQAEIATRFGTSQPTISRHLEQAVDAVRKQLRRVVLLTGSIALAGMLSSQTAQAAAARDDFDIGEWNAEEDLAAYLDLMEECMRILRQPLAKQLGEVQNLTAKIKTIPESCVATRTVLPALGRFVEEHLARQARLHNTLAALAVERYRLKHKKLPEKLDDLVPEFLHAVSIDPFTGEAIVYKKLLKGYVVYRLGNDQEDDGGIRNLQHWREGDIPFDVAR